MAPRRRALGALALAAGAWTSSAEVLHLAGARFPGPSDAFAVFVTNSPGRGEQLTVEGVLLAGSAANSSSGLSIAVLRSRGPWPDLICGLDGEALLAHNVTADGAALFRVGQAGVSVPVTAGTWAVVLANCGASGGPAIATGTVSLTGPSGHLATQEADTVPVQAAFALAYTAAAAIWLLTTTRRAGSWSDVPWAQVAVSGLAALCCCTTLANLGALAVKQLIPAFAVDATYFAQGLRAGQLPFTFMGVAAGAARVAAADGAEPATQAPLAMEIAVAVLSVGMLVPLRLLHQKTSGTVDIGGMVPMGLLALAMPALACTLALKRVGDCLGELREFTSRVPGTADETLTRLQYTAGLLVLAALFGVGATGAALTFLQPSYRDVVLAEHVCVATVLVLLMAIWGGESVGESYSCAERVPCPLDGDDEEESTVCTIGKPSVPPAE